MIIVWPNSDQTFTISQRRSPSYAPPTIDANAGFTATLMPTLSFTNTSNTVISFSVPLSAVTLDSGRQALIWAYGSTNPNTAAASGSIMQHRASGTAFVDLSSNESSTSGTPATSTGSISIPTFGPSSTGTSNAQAVGRTSYQNALIVHAILGSLFAMLFLPLGVLIARFTRSTHVDRPHKWWFPLHAAWQGVISLAIGVAAIALGYQLESKRGGGEVKSTHRTMGLVVLILLLVQSVLGVVTHWRRQILRMRSSKRSPVNYLHIFLGVGLLAISWAQVWTGLDYEWPIWSGYGRAGTGWRAGWAVGVAVGNQTNTLTIAPDRTLHRRLHLLTSKAASRRASTRKRRISRSSQFESARRETASRDRKVIHDYCSLTNTAAMPCR